MGGLSRSGRVMTEQSRKGGRGNESIICVNPVSVWCEILFLVCVKEFWLVGLFE
jgi:hypothetical protein